jgi:hypothetical protein
MKADQHLADEAKVPTRWAAAIFRAKSLGLKTKRFLIDTFFAPVKAHGKTAHQREAPVISESRTRLWTETDAAERFLVAGKIQNLRLALAALSRDGRSARGALFQT